ncbi:nucleotidyltransferase family protein [Xanthobacteraceae bacterium Astr-EGSB]|uniref:nucleotidyltransferase family protein n=1 Tax=Astrobacterium formosum TaxID=3069710 RepID=UPI0027B18AD1|nr:nucleotidyltransferase family protein [Xanthobacteraceae bacterium Astr-EGSB]
MRLFADFEDRPPLRHEQELLLRAVLASKAEGRDALARWIAETDFDTLDPASFRLVPALFARWGADAAAALHHGRMKGIYRYFLFRSSLVAAAARPVLAAFAAAGVEALAIKGLALGLRYHKNVALRPMSDVDVLIRHADLAEADAVLRTHGWRYRYGAAKKLRDIHSHDYVDDRSSGFDLHWFALPESAAEGADGGFWSRAETIDWQGQPLRMPAREDLALIAMVNAIREADAMHCVWIYDVAALIADAPRFNWNLLWAEAGRHGVRTQVFSALLLLSQVAPWLIPEACLHACLATDPVLTLDRLRAVVAETRTDTLTAMGRAYAAECLGSVRKARWFGLFPARDAYADLVADPAVAKHLRIMRDKAGEIVGIYMHRCHIPLLEQLFVVADAATLAAALADLGREGEITLPRGCLGLREATSGAYAARVDLAAPPHLTLPAGEAGKVALYVINASDEAWVVAEETAALYGISYHLHDDADTLVAWDQPRTYFMKPRPGTLAFVAPGQRLACQMKVHAPATPGRYCLHLDVLRETVTWFSAMGERFPVVALEVIA